MLDTQKTIAMAAYHGLILENKTKKKILSDLIIYAHERARNVQRIEMDGRHLGQHLPYAIFV